MSTSVLAAVGSGGIVGFMLGLLGGGATITVSTWQGLGIFFACLPVAIGGYFSAIAQGKTSAACIQMIAKRPEETGKAVILPAMVETYAVLALLMSIILVNGITL